jgi:DNA-binding CsgD family transcriptional regulator
MHFRTIRTGDVAACAAMLPRSAGAGAGAPASLAALWRELLQEERISGGVVVEAPASDRLLAFGLTAFVDERFMADYLAAPKPFLSASLYEGVRSQRSLLLDPLDVGHANRAGALNFVILHFRLAPDVTPGLLEAAVAAAQAGFRLAHGGYRVRRVLQEAHGRHEVAMLTSAGLRLKSDYSEYFAANGMRQPPGDRPVLMGLYGDDPESRLFGTLAASLFHYSEPRFYFSPGEQRVLARAVLDESDEEIARELGLSIAAVKKVWRRAYERIDGNDSGLFAPDASRPGSIRGKEKRRILVRYLRYHLHELRPIVRRQPGRPAIDRRVLRGR